MACQLVSAHDAVLLSGEADDCQREIHRLMMAGSVAREVLEQRSCGFRDEVHVACGHADLAGAG
jgi:hypothetical protein